MSRWYGDEDPFSKVGVARVIVVRHKPEFNWRGEKDNCIQIMHVETFQFGFLCPEIKKSRYGSGPCRYTDDCVREDAEHKINHLFKSKPIGIYELTGEIWHWSSQSYEGEWDGDSELREPNIQQISFDHAVTLNSEPWFDMMRSLIPHSESRDPHFLTETDIHPYMTHQQILVNHANALTRIINQDRYSYSSTNYKDSTVEELEANIHMLMLQIDSEKQHMQPKALEIDQAVQDVIKEHRNWMDPEF